MQDPDKNSLLKRINTLEKNQREIIELLKKTLSTTKYPNIKELVKELARKLSIERRSQKRIQISIPINYEYSAEHKIISDHGKSFNISDSGMCFYTHTPLQEGLNLQVHSKHIWDSPRASIVRWCNKKHLNFYQVGVSFR